MPGRHSGGSLGGGSRGGGFGGSGGFGGRGGGFGGMPGGGWGGGWRPRGPWYPRGGGWGWGRGFGWGMGWLPWLFMPRFGFGGGFGCGGIGLLAVLFCFLMMFIGGFGGSSFNSGYGGYSGFGGNNNSSSSSGSGLVGLSSESPLVQTQTALDLGEMHKAFDTRIPQWESSVQNNQNLSIPPADAGLTQDNNTKEVLYGKCGSALYLYVVENTTPDNVPANGEGYVFTTASSAGACHPPQWTVYDSEQVEQSRLGTWYFVQLSSH